MPLLPKVLMVLGVSSINAFEGPSNIKPRRPGQFGKYTRQVFYFQKKPASCSIWSLSHFVQQIDTHPLNTDHFIGN